MQWFKITTHADSYYKLIHNVDFIAICMHTTVILYYIVNNIAKHTRSWRGGRGGDNPTSL